MPLVGGARVSPTDGTVSYSTSTTTPVDSSTTATTDSTASSAVSSLTFLGDVTGAGTASIVLTLAPAGTAGSYAVVTTDTKGRVVSGRALTSSDVTAALGFTPGGQANLTFAGDATGSGTTAITLALKNTGTVGTYSVVTTDAQGRVVSGAALTSATVISALGFTPYSAANPAGYTTTNQSLTITGDATGSGSTSINLTLKNTGAPGTYSYITTDAQGRVTTGRVLQTNDIITALGYTPYNSSNPSGYTSSNQTITVSGDVTGSGSASLALTLKNTGAAGTYATVTTDAQGRVVSGRSLQSTDITSALGFTPYNVSNPSGFITSNQAITYNGDVTGTGTTAVNLTLAASGVTPGTYNQVTVNAKGIITAGVGQAITIVGDGTSSGSGTLNLTLASVGTAGTYNKVTTDAKGRVVAGGPLAFADVTGALGFTPYNAANPSNYLTTNQTITYSGDASGSGSSSVTLTLANSGVTIGTYTKIVTDSKGRVTLGTNLGSSDITTALGFTPYSASNPNAYISTNQTITASGDVTGSGTTSLALTLKNTGSPGTYGILSTDAQGRVTTGRAMVPSDITAALGFTPYNNTNPSGYISQNQTVTLTGDVTGSGTTSLATTLANTGVTPGTYNQVTVNAKGLITAGVGQAITIVGDATSSGSGTLTLTLASTGVTPGTYNQVTVNAKGLVTAGVGQAITIIGDATSSGSGTLTLTLATVGTVGTYSKVVTDAKGRVTSGSVLAAADVNTALGFTVNTMAQQAATSVAITGGSIVGVATSATTLTNTSGRYYHTRVLTTGSTTLTTADHILVVNKTTGAATSVGLPASPGAGLTFTVKDGKGDAATNNITITPAAGVIDGAASLVISTGYSAASMVYDGTQWNLI